MRDLTDAQWEVIRPLLPPPKKRGRPPELASDRLRWIIERTIRWLGHFRRLVVRDERLVHL